MNPAEPIKLKVSYRLKANLGDYEQAEIVVENSRLRYENCERRLETYLKEKEIDLLSPWSITVSDSQREELTARLEKREKGLHGFLRVGAGE